MATPTFNGVKSVEIVTAATVFMSPDSNAATLFQNLINTIYRLKA